MDYKEGSLSVLAPRWQTTTRLLQIKPSPFWLWSLPGDLQATPPPFVEGVRSKGPTRFPESSQQCKGTREGKYNPCQAAG